MTAFYTTPEAAKRLGLSPATLETWRSRSSAGPEFVKFGKSVRYSEESLLQWADGKRRTSTSDTSGR